jgi:hypothetical protein
MTKITWTGEDKLHDDPRGGPVSTVWRGLTFPKNKAVEVTDEATIAKAKNHPQFKVGGDDAKAKAAPAEEANEAADEPRHASRKK